MTQERQKLYGGTMRLNHGSLLSLLFLTLLVIACQQ